MFAPALYSACKALIGSNSAALLAGYQPKPIPVARQMVTDRITANGDQAAGQPANC